MVEVGRGVAKAQHELDMSSIARLLIGDIITINDKPDNGKETQVVSQSKVGCAHNPIALD
jgi:flagellar motor switch protein FliM